MPGRGLVRTACGADFSEKRGGAMQYFYEVETQGLSSDWRHATGDSNSVFRGKMSLSDVENALKHVVDVDMADMPNGDFFPPHILVSTESGLLRFSLAGRSLYCVEAGRAVSYDEACSLVRGETTLPDGGRRADKRTSRSGASRARRVPWWRRLLGVLVGLPLVAFGGLVIATSIEDNNLEGGLVGGGLFILVGGVIYWLAVGRYGRGNAAGRADRGNAAGTGYMQTPYMYGRDDVTGDTGDTNDTGDLRREVPDDFFGGGDGGDDGED